MDTQIQKAQKTSAKRNPKRPTLTHMIFKLSKFKGKNRILKVAREKQTVMYKGTPITLSVNFSAEDGMACTKHGKKKVPSKNTIPGRIILQKSRRNKDFAR